MLLVWPSRSHITSPTKTCRLRQTSRLPALRQEAIDAEYWGFPVQVHLIRRQIYPQTFSNYYLRGIVSAADQPRNGTMGWPNAGQTCRCAAGHQPPDIVVVNNLHATCAVLRSGRLPKRLFVDLDDVQHLVRLRWCKAPPHSPGKMMMLLHVPALIAAERRAARIAERMFVCSEPDPRAHLGPVRLPAPGGRAQRCRHSGQPGQPYD